MGQTPATPSKPNFLPIAPMPGTYGAPTRKKNHITVYSPHMNLFCYLPTTLDSTVHDIKHQLQLKLSHPLSMRLYQHEQELEDSQTLAFYHLTERSLLKVEFLDEPSSLEVESMESLGKLDLSALSGISKDSMAVGSTTPDSSSSSSSRPWEIDFSVYALPDAEISVQSQKRSKKRRGLRPIPEEDACKPAS